MTIFVQSENCTASDNFTAVSDEVQNHLLEIEKRRLTINKSYHIHPKALLHLCHLVEVVEYHLWHCACLQVNANTDLGARFIAHFRDAFNLLVAH